MPKSPASPPRSRSPHLEVQLAGVRLARGGRRVLAGVDWHVRPGEHWVLEGRNGAGKTQLLKLVAGDVWPAPGSPGRRAWCWRGEWHSHPLEVREHIAYVGPERQDRYAHYEWNFRALGVVCTGFQRSDIPMAPFSARERELALRLLARVGCAHLAARRFLTLSQGEQRLVLLARALAWRPALLLLDEPFNGLDESQRARMRRVLAALGRSRLPWIIATHRPDEVPAGVTHHAHLDRGRLATGPRRGRVVGRVAPARGRAAGRGARARAQVHAQAHAQAGTGEVLVQAQRLSVWQGTRRVLGPIDMEVRAGDCWVVHGPNGSGKSTLLGALQGEFPVADTGRLWRAGTGQGIAPFQRRLGLVSPQLQASLPRFATALECVVAGARGAFRLDGASEPHERRAALAALRRCGAMALADRAYGTLSWGQARRVLFARALVRGPDILLLDEALTGLDVGTRAALAALLDGPALGHTTLIMATHHRDEWPLRTTHEVQLRAGAPVHAGRMRRRRAGAA